ncbi:MAG: DUF192 domain-containing protein [Nostoc indistinguendum CM1-VF10]|jgi:uncharacterized membrane protein (UPF0127 family)|nr:DUF192 domain-containing protein [Nostoc indistinguendum CM1-VF10]
MISIKNSRSCLTLVLSAGFIFVENPIVLAQSNQEPLSQRQILPISATANLAGQTFNLEVAQTREQQAIGLMNRTFLPENQGMLFPQDAPSAVAFWMRNTLIPLDMIFVYQSTVIEIAQNVQPCMTEYCPLYFPAVDVNQIIANNVTVDDFFVSKSKPVGINYEGFEIPQNISFLLVDSVIEVKGGRTGELGLRKGARVIVSQVPEPSSYLSILIFSAFSVLRMKHKYWKKKTTHATINPQLET